ncbi:MAG: response regulator transcription factor [Cyclobacteriaceae bacterium]|nr:response regulator transcription factor [Cyclobacteriaceae bacterium]
MKILLVDDHRLIRDAIRSYMEDDDAYEIVGEASQGQEAIRTLEELEVDVVLMDINMPIMGGIECTKEIKKRWPKIKVIALSMMSDNQHIKQMMGVGASGYVLKNCTEKELKKAIKMVYEGDTYYSAEVTEVVMVNLMKNNHTKTSNLVVDMPLTEREKEVLELIIKEHTNNEIADKLFISNRTVDAHKRNLLEKTGSKNVAGLVMYAINNQLFEDL